MKQKKRQVTINSYKGGLKFKFDSPLSSTQAAEQIAWIYGQQTGKNLTYIGNGVTSGGYAVPYMIIGPKNLRLSPDEQAERHPETIIIYQIPPDGTSFQTIEEKPETRIEQFSFEDNLDASNTRA